MNRTLELDAATRLLVIAPHPDDEALGCAGLIQQAVDSGAALRVWFVTNGDNNPWPQRAFERRLRIDSAARQRWGKRRRAEAIASLSRLGVMRGEIRFASLPDQSLTQSLLHDDEAFRSLLRQELAGFSPTIIVSPSLHDTHSDHSAIAAMVRLTLRESPEPPQLLEYMIHGYGGREEGRIAIELSPSQVQAKREAISCHRTQVALSRGRFLGFATPIEQFESPDIDGQVDRHPVRSITRADEGWRIEMRPRRWFDRLARCELDVIACEGGAIVARRRIALAGFGGSRRRRPAIVDRASGEPIGRARWASPLTLIIPADTLLPASRIFIKRSGGIAFFDEAGWKELALTELFVVEAHPVALVAAVPAR